METVVRPACRALLRLVSLLLPAATAIAQPAPRLDAAGFLPPAPGTTWLYEIQRDGATRLVTKRITRVLRFEGAPCVEISVQEENPTRPAIYEHFALRREGVVQVGRPNPHRWLSNAYEIQPRALWLATPVGLTPEWDVGVPQGGARASLQGIGEAVEVPAGTFACARVQYASPDPASKQLFEYAPGVCVVRDQWIHDGKVVQRTELRRFQAGTLHRETTAAEVATALATQGTDVVELTHPYLGLQFESRFFRIGTGEQAQLARSFRGAITPFAVDSGASWQALLTEEGLAPEPAPMASVPINSNHWTAAGMLDVLRSQDVPDDVRILSDAIRSTSDAKAAGRPSRISVDMRIGTNARTVRIETANGRIESVVFTAPETAR